MVQANFYKNHVHRNGFTREFSSTIARGAKGRGMARSVHPRSFCFSSIPPPARYSANPWRYLGRALSHPFRQHPLDVLGKAQ
jgi:hypothetical protein